MIADLARVLALSLVLCMLCSNAGAFQLWGTKIASTRGQKLRMADVELLFPNNKKVKAVVGSAMKDAAKKAGLKLLLIFRLVSFLTCCWKDIPLTTVVKKVNADHVN